MNPLPDLDQVARSLAQGYPLCDEQVILASCGVRLRVRSNSKPLMDRLRGYFADLLEVGSGDAIEVLAIERAAPRLGLRFSDWARQPGKSGRKDSILDIAGGRLLRKVRTGMLFLQSAHWRIAAGPCRDNDNQVINFINSQLMNGLQQRHWLICHAAGLGLEGRALGLAGLSGGGKSTLLLHLMEQEGGCFLSNDRLFLRRQGPQVMAQGIPKLPRINPGTLVGNARLHGLVSVEQLRAWRALPEEDLWHLEEKLDVDIPTVYGPDRIAGQLPLAAFVVLNWQRHSRDRTCLQRVELERRSDLLSAMMKSPGPFYQQVDGAFQQDSHPLDPAPYRRVLAGVPVYEARGKVDFKALVPQCLEVLTS